MTGFRPSRRTILLTVFVACGLLPLEEATAQTPAPGICEPSREVRAELRKAADQFLLTPPTLRTIERGRAIYRPLLAKYPENLHIHRAFLNSVQRVNQAEGEALVVEYRDRAAYYGGDPAFQYLYAAVLLRAGRFEDGRARIEKLASADPPFPWAFFALAGIHARSKDTAEHSKTRSDLEQLFALCPDALDGFAYALEVDDKAFQERAAKRLRQRLESTTGDEDRYRTLWALEYKLAPNADAYRSRVDADLERLRQPPLTVPRAVAILAGMPRPVGPDKPPPLLEEVYDAFPALAPLAERQIRLEAKNPVPGEGATPEAAKTWARRLLADFGPGYPFPDFDLKDLSGRLWTRADFAGRRVFVNFWATWCGPCRAELPAIQKLWERTKGRKDLLILTFNTDRDEKLIEPFMRENGYGFPVILASTFLTKNAGDATGVPQNWLVSERGDIVLRRLGLSSVDPRFDEKLLALLEEVGKASPPEAKK